MPGPITWIALLVVVGLVLLAAVAFGRARGHEPRSLTVELISCLAGVALAFITLLAPVMPLVLFPATLAAVLCAAWVEQRSWRPLGSFLVGGGALWLVVEAQAALNDLADSSVSRPTWSAVPLVLAVGALVVGIAVLSPRGGPRVPDPPDDPATSRGILPRCAPLDGTNRPALGRSPTRSGVPRHLGRSRCR